MALNYQPFSVRVPEKLIGKIKHMAICGHRSANKEIELALEKHVAKFEKDNGEIILDENFNPIDNR